MCKGILIRCPPVVSSSDNFPLIYDHTTNRYFLNFPCFFRLTDRFLHVFFVFCLYSCSFRFLFQRFLTAFFISRFPAPLSGDKTFLCCFIHRSFIPFIFLELRKCKARSNSVSELYIYYSTGFSIH